MRIENRDNHFEMTVAIAEDRSLPSLGDAYVTLDFSSHGFSGANEVWVAADALVAFCQALAELERNLAGEARLCSLDPDELELRVFPASREGHLAVAGRTGYEIGDEHGNFWHEARFGFEFEPWQLRLALQLPWVRAHAA